MEAKEKKITYPTSAIIKDKNGKKLFSVITNFYVVGIYVAIYHEGHSMPDQINIPHKDIEKFMKQFVTKNLKEGTSVKFGHEQTIIMDKEKTWRKGN